MAKEKSKNDPLVPSTALAVPTYFEVELDQHIRAGYQVMAIDSPEEARIRVAVERVAAASKMTLITWDNAAGFSFPQNIVNDQKYESPVTALRAVTDPKGPFDAHKSAIFVFYDLDAFFSNPTVCRALRSACEGNKLVNKNCRRPILLVGPNMTIPDKLKASVTVLDFTLPDEQQLGEVLRYVQTSIAATPDTKEKAQCAPDLAEKIVPAMLGLTSTEAENALARCLVKHEGFKPEMLETIKAEKAGVIKKSEVLTYIPEQDQVSRAQIGGFDLLLKWIDRRALAYTREARAANLDYPKGITLVGIPGTGKSMVAAAVSKLLGLPGYIMDVGSVFGSLVGQSEARMRAAIAQIKAQQGCVLLIDEADKAFGGAAESQGDSGVTRRVFGQLLTWLASKNDRTFVIMTMNRTKGIPPEFLRAGRFDAVFYTDLPHPAERRQILEIHLTKRGVDLSSMGLTDADWTLLLNKTETFVGSELEETVKEARAIAFERRRVSVPKFDEMFEAAAGIIPIATLDAEAITSIREWCKDRAKPVSSPPPSEERTQTRRTRQVRLEPDSYN